MENKVKIIGTMGPASQDPDMIKKLIQSGLSVARLNFSHGTHEAHQLVYNNLRKVSKELNQPLAILMDLQGPKIRVGKFEDSDPIILETGGAVKITTRDILGTRDLISTTYKGLITDIKVGDFLLLDDGLLKLQVHSKSHDTIVCEILVGGVLKQNKGINLPGIKVSISSLTDKDRKDLEFGISLGVDYVALSFVRTANCIHEVKAIMSQHNVNIPVIAKIEKPEAVDNIDEIMDVADAIMVARGDLGVEIQPDYVPIVQKELIKKAIQKNKPIITATQMLETMSYNPIPTRAEASDVANAIFDGTDAIMLSGETATGKYPLKAVQMMSQIAKSAEASEFLNYNLQFDKDQSCLVLHAVAQSAVNILHEIGAKAIVTFSLSGKTARLVSKQRPKAPIYLFTSNQKVYDQMGLVWGVKPFLIPEISDAADLVSKAEALLLENKLIAKEDLIVLVTGRALKSGSTNLVKIHHVGQDD